MKNKKGFTLVELLAVIVILGVLATVATPIVLTVSKNTKRKMYDAKARAIEAAAIMCAEREGISSNTCKSVGGLCFGGYLTQEDKAEACQNNPTNNKEMGLNEIDDSGDEIACNANSEKCNCKISIVEDNNTHRYSANFPLESEKEYPPCKKD